MPREERTANTLGYVLAILEFHQQEFTAFELCDILGIPQGSAYRLLRHLEGLALVERTGTSVLRRVKDKWMSKPCKVWRKRARLLRQ